MGLKQEEMKQISRKALTPRDVSFMYGISEGTLGNLRCQNRGPRYFKAGRKVLYRVEDIERYLFQNPVLTLDSLHRSAND